MEDFLVRLLVAVLVYFLGEKVLALISNADLRNILMIVLIVVVVLYAAFGTVLLSFK